MLAITIEMERPKQVSRLEMDSSHILKDTDWLTSFSVMIQL